jgi:hypothetical protein
MHLMIIYLSLTSTILCLHLQFTERKVAINISSKNKFLYKAVENLFSLIKLREFILTSLTDELMCVLSFIGDCYAHILIHSRRLKSKLFTTKQNKSSRLGFVRVAISKFLFEQSCNALNFNENHQTVQKGKKWQI